MKPCERAAPRKYPHISTLLELTRLAARARYRVVRLPFEHQMALKRVSLDEVLASPHLKEFIKKKPLTPYWDDFLRTVWYPVQDEKIAAAYKDGAKVPQSSTKCCTAFLKWLAPLRFNDKGQRVEGSASWPTDPAEVADQLEWEQEAKERKEVEAAARKAAATGHEQATQTWTTIAIASGRIPGYHGIDTRTPCRRRLDGAAGIPSHHLDDIANHDARKRKR